jgi:hypothetical protein
MPLIQFLLGLVSGIVATIGVDAAIHGNPLAAGTSAIAVLSWGAIAIMLAGRGR